MESCKSTLNIEKGIATTFSAMLNVEPSLPLQYLFVFLRRIYEFIQKTLVQVVAKRF